MKTVTENTMHTDEEMKVFAVAWKMGLVIETRYSTSDTFDPIPSYADRIRCDTLMRSDFYNTVLEGRGVPGKYPIYRIKPS
jgi:hypothetical protein